MLKRVAVYNVAAGDIVNVVIYDDSVDWSPGPDLNFEECPADVGVGWRRTAPNLFEPIPVPLAQRRAAAALAIERGFTDRVVAGFNYGGANFQIDPQSQANIATWGTRASAVLAGVPGATWPASFGWIKTDNARQSFSAAEFFAFSQAAQDYVTALYLVRRGAKDAVAASEDPQATVAAIAWPAN